MPGTVKQFLDYSTNTAGDSGENNTASVLPVADGEATTAAVLTRPTESVRQRTEAVRNVMSDALYLLDADRSLLVTGPGLVTWPGSTTTAHTGIPTISDALFLVPMLTPGFAQTSPIPPVASTYGVIHLKRASDSMNSIAVSSLRRSYAGGDRISVEVAPGGAFTCVLDVENVMQRVIKIVATGATTLGAVVTALNALTPLAPDNTALVSAALEGGALSGDLLLTTQAKQFMAGNYDGEGHAVTPANLASFFASNPTQALAEGDTLCVSYAMVADPASTGGRRQSIPENSNTAVPAGSFFNSRVHPEKLANALPLCKVINGRLVFASGIEVPQGATSYDLSGISTASGIAYAGGPAWADGTTNPATTVEAQLDKIITDLVGAAGTGKIQGSAVGTDLTAATLAAQIVNLATNWLKMGRNNTITGVQNFAATIGAALGMLVGANQNITLSGTGRVLHGAYDVSFGIEVGDVIERTGAVPTHTAATGGISQPASETVYYKLPRVMTTEGIYQLLVAADDGGAGAGFTLMKYDETTLAYAAIPGATNIGISAGYAVLVPTSLVQANGAVYILRVITASNACNIKKGQFSLAGL